MIEQPQEMPEDEEMDDEGGDPAETEAFETMVAGLRAHLFGAAEQGVRDKLRQSQDLTGDIGSMALALVMEAGKQASEVGIETDFELLSAVATEVIDDLFEIAQAMGLIDEVEDDDRQEAMIAAVTGYLTTSEADPAEQEEAKQVLAAMTENGMVDGAVNDIRRLGARRGIDPFAGAEQAAPPEQKPIRMMGE